MLRQPLNISISFLIFILVSAFGLIFYIKGFDGLIFSDDFAYSRYAHQLTVGRFKLIDDLFNQRWGVFLPVSVLYYFFGVNDITTTLWPFLCHLGILSFLFFYFKKDTLVCCSALLLVGLNFYPIFFSNKLFPDVIVSLFCLLTVYAIITRDSRPYVVSVILFLVFFYYGFIVKETILYLLPFIGLVFIMDIRSNENMDFWKWVILGSVIILLGYFAFYYFNTGDPLYRFRIIQESHYVSAGSYYDKTFYILLERLTFQPFFMLLSSELAIPVLLGLPLLFLFKVLPTEEKLWLLSAVLLLMTFWFGTTSFKVYNPIALNGRMFIMVVPIWSIVAGFTFKRVLSYPSIGLVYVLEFIFASVIAYFYIQNIRLLLVYGLLTAVFCFFYLLILKNNFRVQYLFVLFTVLLIHPAYTMIKSSDSNHKALNVVFKSVIKDGKEKVIVTDPIIKESYSYYFDFTIPKGVEVISFRDSLVKTDRKEVLVLVSEKHIKELQGVGSPVPPSFVTIPATWQLQLKKSDVSLYKVNNYLKVK